MALQPLSKLFNVPNFDSLCEPAIADQDDEQPGKVKGWQRYHAEVRFNGREGQNQGDHYYKSIPAIAAVIKQAIDPAIMPAHPFEPSQTDG